MPTWPYPCENLYQIGQWISLCHIILAGVNAGAGHRGATGYGGSFCFPPKPGRSIGAKSCIIVVCTIKILFNSKKDQLSRDTVQIRYFIYMYIEYI